MNDLTDFEKQKFLWKLIWLQNFLIAFKIYTSLFLNAKSLKCYTFWDSAYFQINHLHFILKTKLVHYLTPRIQKKSSAENLEEKMDFKVNVWKRQINIRVHSFTVTLWCWFTWIVWQIQPDPVFFFLWKSFFLQILFKSFKISHFLVKIFWFGYTFFFENKSDYFKMS